MAGMLVNYGSKTSEVLQKAPRESHAWPLGLRGLLGVGVMGMGLPFVSVPAQVPWVEQVGCWATAAASISG